MSRKETIKEIISLDSRFTESDLERKSDTMLGNILIISTGQAERDLEELANEMMA